MRESEQDASPIEFMVSSSDDGAVGVSADVTAGRRRWVVGAVAVMIGLVAAGLGAASLIKSPAQQLADASAPPADVLASPVERRVLKETVVVRGTVATSQSVDVTAAGSGNENATRMVVTRLPIRNGEKVAPGKVVLEISGRPIIALKGKVPMYRDLRPDARGDDVAQLQRALGSLGYSSGYDEKGHFGAGTKAAVTSFYRELGYDALPAQEDSDEALAAGEDTVVQAQRSLEDAPKGKAKARARQDLGKAQMALAAVRAASGPMVPAAEVIFLKSFPAQVATTSVRLGDEVTGTAMTISSGGLVVSSYLQPAQKELIRAGMRAEILSERSGKIYSAKVISVADVLPVSQGDAPDGSASSQGEAAAQGYPMIIAPREGLPADFYGEGVRVTVEAASTDGEALVVPVTAISAGADVKTVVTVVSHSGGRRKVEVLTGTNGDGFVEVVPVGGARLAEGEQVLTGIKNSGVDGPGVPGFDK